MASDSGAQAASKTDFFSYSGDRHRKGEAAPASAERSIDRAPEAPAVEQQRQAGKKMYDEVHKDWHAQSEIARKTPLQLNEQNRYEVQHGDCLSTIAERRLRKDGEKINGRSIDQEVKRLRNLNGDEFHSLNSNGKKAHFLKDGWQLRLYEDGAGPKVSKETADSRSLAAKPRVEALPPKPRVETVDPERQPARREPAERPPVVKQPVVRQPVEGDPLTRPVPRPPLERAPVQALPDNPPVPRAKPHYEPEQRPGPYAPPPESRGRAPQPYYGEAAPAPDRSPHTVPPELRPWQRPNVHGREVQPEAPSREREKLPSPGKVLGEVVDGVLSIPKKIVDFFRDPNDWHKIRISQAGYQGGCAGIAMAIAESDMGTGKIADAGRASYWYRLAGRVPGQGYVRGIDGIATDLERGTNGRLKTEVHNGNGREAVNALAQAMSRGEGAVVNIHNTGNGHYIYAMGLTKDAHGRTQFLIADPGYQARRVVSAEWLTGQIKAGFVTVKNNGRTPATEIPGTGAYRLAHMSGDTRLANTPH